MSPFPLLSNPSKPKITRLISFSGLNIISHRVPKKRDTTSAICSSLVGDGGIFGFVITSVFSRLLFRNPIPFPSRTSRERRCSLS